MMLKRTAAIFFLFSTAAVAKPEYDYIAVHDGWYVYSDGEVCWIASQAISPFLGDATPKVQVTFYGEDRRGEFSVYDPAQYHGGTDIAVDANGSMFILDKDEEDPEYAFDNTEGLMDALSKSDELQVQFTSKSGGLHIYRFSLVSFNLAAGHARFHCLQSV